MKQTEVVYLFAQVENELLNMTTTTFKALFLLSK